MTRDDPLTRRERQLLDILYRLGKATAAEVRDALDDAPSYSAVRALLSLMEEKGLVRHARDGRRYVWSPSRSSSKARRAALRQVLDNLCQGSVELAVTSLLDLESRRLSDSDLDRISSLIDEARTKKKPKGRTSR